MPTREPLPGEEERLLPGEVENTQPSRWIEFPRRFQETLLHLPRQVVRTALTPGNDVSVQPIDNR